MVSFLAFMAALILCVLVSATLGLVLGAVLIKFVWAPVIDWAFKN